MTNNHPGTGGHVPSTNGAKSAQSLGANRDAQPLRVFVENQITNGDRKWRMGLGWVLEGMLLLAALSAPLLLTETLDSKLKTPPGEIRFIRLEPTISNQDIKRAGSGNPAAPLRNGLPRPTWNPTKLAFNPDSISPETELPGVDWQPGNDSGVLGWGVPGGTGDPSAWVGIGARPAPPPPPKVVRIGGDIQPPRLIRKQQPRYPQVARNVGIQGDVVLEALLGADGRVQGVTVIEGHPLLRDAAVAAVQRWEYAPTLLNGEPVGVRMRIIVQFRMAR